MNKIFVMIFTLDIIYQEVYTFPDTWTAAYNINSIESEKFQYNTINENCTRTARKASDSDGKIFFPDNDSKISVNPIPMYNPIGPVTTCHNSTFCEYVPYYPTDFVKNAIKARHDLRYLVTVNNTTEIDERFASTSNGGSVLPNYDDDALCVTNEQIVYPKTAENKQKNWVFIVNDDEFLQGVLIETCVSPESACRIIDGFAHGYTTICRQKYIYRQLASITTNGIIMPDLFRFPSSCCCHVKFNGDPLAKIANDDAMKTE